LKTALAAHLFVVLHKIKIAVSFSTALLILFARLDLHLPVQFSKITSDTLALLETPSFLGVQELYCERYIFYFIVRLDL
jgi:hypothetical protein